MKIILVAQEVAHCEFMGSLIPHFSRLRVRVAEFFADGDWEPSLEVMACLYDHISTPGEKKIAVFSGMCFGNRRNKKIDLPPYECEAITRADMLQIPFGFYGEYWPDGNWPDYFWFTKFLGRAKIVIGPDWSEKPRTLMRFIRKSYCQMEFGSLGNPESIAEMLTSSLFGFSS